VSSDDPARGLRWGAFAVAALAIAWGSLLHVRPVLAYGLAQLGVLLALRAYPRLAARRLEVERDLPEAACEDDDVTVAFTLRNRGRLPLFAPVVEDRFTPGKVPARRAVVFPGLPGRRRARASYRGRCFAKRGLYAIGPARARLWDPTGLFQVAVPVAPPAQLTVYPALEPLAELPVAGLSRAALYGGAALREAGDGDRILGVRDYRPGDPLRRVHWPTVARRGRLAVLEYERHVARQVAVAIDLSAASLRGLGRQSTLEVSVHLAASVAARCVARGDRVGLEAEAAAPVRIPPARGRRQLARILEVLATVRPSGERPLSAVLGGALPRLVPGQTVLAVVAEAEADLEPLLVLAAELRARRCRLTAVLLDPRTFPRIHGDEPGRRAPSVHDVAEALEREGAVVHVVASGAPIREALERPYAGRPRIRIRAAELAGREAGA